MEEMMLSGFAPFSPVDETQPRIRVAQIDNFNPTSAEDAWDVEDIHFNHGETVANMLRAGGADPTLQHRVSVTPFNVGNPEGQSLEQIDRWATRIVEALRQITALARENAVDVVCIALQSPVETPATAEVRRQIAALMALGVPVVIAAGNQSEDVTDLLDFAPNTLALPSAFVVQATLHGNRVFNSNPGNVSAEGRSTSFAAPAVATVVGDYKAQGLGMSEIKARLAWRLALHHGTLPAAIAPNGYTTRPSSPLVEAGKALLAS